MMRRRDFSPPRFQPTVHSPSLRKASRSNPRPHFSNCMRNDVTWVRRCWTSLKHIYTVLHTTTKPQGVRENRVNEQDLICTYLFSPFLSG